MKASASAGQRRLKDAALAPAYRIAIFLPTANR
jgi:hypothetical protein